MFKQPHFSFIMPTYNRAFCIKNAIDSVLAQTYPHFELIIIDDGSSDGTEELIRKDYAEELAAKCIVFVKGGHKGVCQARNQGLQTARNEWIAYIDTDNTIIPDYLKTYALAINLHPWRSLFYAQYIGLETGVVNGKKFRFKSLLKGNYIDMGTFVHHRRVYEKLGGFDESLTRLVDFDLILTYTKKYKPVFIKKIVLNYDDSNKHSRICTSSREVAVSNALKILSKHYTNKQIKASFDKEFLKQLGL